MQRHEPNRFIRFFRRRTALLSDPFGDGPVRISLASDAVHLLPAESLHVALVESHHTGVSQEYQESPVAGLAEESESFHLHALFVYRDGHVHFLFLTHFPFLPPLAD